MSDQFKALVLDQKGEEFKREKKKLGDIIKNQFKHKKNDNYIYDNPEYENIIEWEE